MAAGPGRVGRLRNGIDGDDPRLERLPGSGYALRKCATDIDSLSRSAAPRSGLVTTGLAVPAFLAEAAEGLPEGDGLRRRLDTSLLPAAWTRTIRKPG